MHNDYLELRRQAESIWQAGVKAVKPQVCVPAALQELTPVAQGWRANREYLIIGGGKAGSAMGQATEDFLFQAGIPLTRIKGWLNVPEGSQPESLQSIHLHPARPAGVNFPTPAAVTGTLQMLQLTDQAPENALIICLVSGGGSALLCAPVDGVPLDDKVQISKQLSAAGASIQQLNSVRKHLSLIKGGGLAQRCFPDSKNPKHLQLIGLIISDVIGDPLDVIASGPTAPDPTTFADALRVLDELGCRKQAPKSVLTFLEQGAASHHPETLKAHPRPEPDLVHLIIANNRLALNSAGEQARAIGYKVIDLGDHLQGDTLNLADYFKGQLAVWEKQRPCCVLSGGETTVHLPQKPGKGGRNQSMTLALLQTLEESALGNVCLLCAGTDGEDGPTDAAGAFADHDVRQRSLQMRLNAAEFLKRCNAYSFFQRIDALYQPGLTDTNVMDLRVFLFA
jgi:hydroxypyruvate reductase/glycerate 2-kinase